MNQFESRGRPLLHSFPLGTEQFLLVHSREETFAFVPVTLDLFQPICFVVNNNVGSGNTCFEENVSRKQNKISQLCRILNACA